MRCVTGNFIGGIFELFLYSMLHSYYCYEYKTAAMELDFTTSILFFEQQWSYYCGFGFIFTTILYLWKEVGSPLFFLFFPIMVVISIDEDGQGLKAYNEDR